jgi:hypothetical protein
MCHSLSTTKPSSILGKPDNLRHSPRFLCRPTCWSRGTSESSIYRKQRICCCNSALAHFHVSWLSGFIFYPKPLYKSLHQSFFYSFITILPSESGVTIHYSTMLPHNYWCHTQRSQTIWCKFCCYTIKTMTTDPSPNSSAHYI